MALVVGTDEVMFISEKGILIRTRVGEIRETGRNAAGVKLIRLDEGDRLVAMAKVDAEEVTAASVDSPASAEAPGTSPPAPQATDGTPPAATDGDSQV